MAPDLAPVPSNSSIAPPPCLLLSLPPELRAMIFAYAVHQDSDIIYRSIRWRKPVHPAITRTCRQIRKEALSLYFKHNRFSFEYQHGSPYIPEEITCMTQIKINYFPSAAVILLRLVKDLWEVEVGPTPREIPRWRPLHDAETRGIMNAWLMARTSTENARITRAEFSELLNRIRHAVERRLAGHISIGL